MSSWLHPRMPRVVFSIGHLRVVLPSSKCFDDHLSSQCSKIHFTSFEMRFTSLEICRHGIRTLRPAMATSAPVWILWFLAWFMFDFWTLSDLRRVASNAFECGTQDRGAACRCSRCSGGWKCNGCPVAFVQQARIQARTLQQFPWTTTCSSGISRCVDRGTPSSLCLPVEFSTILTLRLGHVELR